MYTIRKKAYILPFSHENIVWGLGALAATLLFFYGYFVFNTILNVVERERLETEIVAASAELAGLESRFLENERRLTMGFAQTLGFHEVRTHRYVTRTGLALTPRGR